MKFEDGLAKLAEAIVTKATSTDPDKPPFAEVLDAFGKLTTYYGLRLKNRGKLSEDDGEPTMGDIMDSIHGADEQEPANGRTSRVPARTRRAHS